MEVGPLRRAEELGVGVGPRRGASLTAGPFPRPALRTGRARLRASGSPHSDANGSRRTHCNCTRPWCRDVLAAIAVTAHRDRRRSEHLCTTLGRLPSRQVAPTERLPGQPGVALAQPADDPPEGKVIDVAERAFGHAVLEVGTPP